MKSKRRAFLKLAGMTGAGLAGGMLEGLATGQAPSNHSLSKTKTALVDTISDSEISIIGQYGGWANSLKGNRLPTLSFRNSEWRDLEAWRKVARQRVIERMGIPDIGSTPTPKVDKQYTYDGLQIQEVSWQLPYGRRTESILLKPVGAKGRLPAILALHCHGGNKYFGCRKITKGPDQLQLMKEHQQVYYDGLAWANEVAKRGYVVLVPDAFTFGSRRVMLQDVPINLRNGNNDDPDTAENIKAYNEWAGNHEHIMAKSLFCAGTSWPAVFFAEDRKALDILASREDVDPGRIGCGGLSGGGLRTVMMAGLDERIKCAVDVGFMSTWKDFLLNKSYTHTWMAYIPLLPNELDFPEILALRTPLPTLVLNDVNDNLYTMPEMKQAEKILSDIYTKAGATDKFKCSYYPGPHKFDANMQTEAFHWFDRWLKA